MVCQHLNSEMLSQTIRRLWRTLPGCSLLFSVFAHLSLSCTYSLTAHNSSHWQPTRCNKSSNVSRRNLICGRCSSFCMVLPIGTKSACVMCTGEEFQTIEAATGNARWPMVDRWHGGCIQVLVS